MAQLLALGEALGILTWSYWFMLSVSSARARRAAILRGRSSSSRPACESTRSTATSFNSGPSYQSLVIRRKRKLAILRRRLFASPASYGATCTD
nr:uncharacterized protein LOC9266156 isoform X2 [Oryza sativa Japonica Group]